MSVSGHKCKSKVEAKLKTKKALEWHSTENTADSAEPQLKRRLYHHSGVDWN